MASLDPKIEAALKNLEEVLKVIEEQDGSQFTVIVIPHTYEQSIHVSFCGKQDECYSLESLVSVAKVFREKDRIKKETEMRKKRNIAY